MNRALLSALLVACSSAIAQQPGVTARSSADPTMTPRSAVEFYNPVMDRFFVTADDDEVTVIDQGGMGSWQRTGLAFSVIDSEQIAASGASAVCRLYASVPGAEDLHFLSASPEECAGALSANPGYWRLESPNAFGAYLPDSWTGACPTGSVPLYRSVSPESGDHRYTTDSNVQLTMMAHGWIAEGYGAFPVSMCVLAQH